MTNAKETEVEQFCDDLQGLLDLTPKKDVLFIIWDWNTKIASQELHGVAGKFGLGIQNKAGQRLTEFCQENTLVVENTLFQQHKPTLRMHITRWLILKSDWLYSLQSKMEKLYTVSKNKSAPKLTVAQIMNSLLSNSDLNKVGKILGYSGMT